MPIANESGLWQAWRMQDGNIMIQALHWDYKPWGSDYLMSASDFGTLLGAVPDGEDSKSPGDERHVMPDAPDLLDLWLEQSLLDEAAASADEDEDVADFGADQLTAYAFDAPRAGVAADEFILHPLEHPDDLFIDDPLADGARKDSPRKDDTRKDDIETARVRADPAFSEQAAQVRRVRPEVDAQLNSGPIQSSGPAPPPAFAARAEAAPAESFAPAFRTQKDRPVTVEVVSDLDREQEALEQEKAVREQFVALMSLMDDEPDPVMERQVAKLISGNGPFSWKQKFMFTGFGLALRRRRKHHLALMCHMRALHFAPDDEHILFNVARAQYETGDISAAINSLKKALDVDPDFTVAANFLAFLRGKAQKA